MARVDFGRWILRFRENSEAGNFTSINLLREQEEDAGQLERFIIMVSCIKKGS